MAKKSVKEYIKRPRGWMLLVVVLSAFILITFFTQIPIERMRYSGGCPSKDNRLSLILDGQQKVQQAREKIDQMNSKREERLRSNPILEGGCSQGLSYAVYIL